VEQCHASASNGRKCNLPYCVASANEGACRSAVANSGFRINKKVGRISA
jgi:hypothetical protein